MSKKMFKFWQHCLLRVPAKTTPKGFTLLELLISVVISSIVVSGLLYLVVEILRIDNREVALETVQRDTQRALDYIADDLKEAVFVYEDLTDPDTIVAPDTPTTFVVDEISGVGNDPSLKGKPILAFWKINRLSSFPPDCDSFSAKEKKDECRALKVRRGSYDLVVYTQIATPGGAWKGSSRIARYELKQYKDLTTLTENGGYVSPRSEVGFSGWKKQAGEEAKGNSSVLVDYIGKPNFGTETVADCTTLTDSNPGDYTLSPPDAKSDTSFFACVRVSTAEDPLNQDVYLFLRGDTTGLATNLSPASAASRFPVLQTQVLVRGILDKSPAD